MAREGQTSTTGDTLWSHEGDGTSTYASSHIRRKSRKASTKDFAVRMMSMLRSDIQPDHDAPKRIVRTELDKRGVKSWAELNVKDQVEVARLIASPSFVLLPTSKWVERWDIAMLLVLVYTCLVTPYQVAFLSPHLGFLFVTDRLVDLAFIADMLVQSHTAFRRENTGGDGRHFWVTNLSLIRRKYLFSWFLFDCLSLASSCFDIANIVLQSSDLHGFKVLRVIRIARLLKLTSVIKGSRIFNRIVGKLEISYATLEIVRWTGALLVSAHLIACIWALVGMLSEDFLDRSWIKQVEAGKGQLLDRHDSFVLYCISLYWALMTITSIGYGDISASCLPEYITAAFLMVAGGILWTRIIGSAIAAVGMLDAERIEHEQRMDSVMLMCKDRNLPRELRSRLRSYFAQSRRMLRIGMYSEITKIMSPALRGEVALRVTEKYLVKISFLTKIVEENFVVALAKALQLVMYPPNEWIVPEAEASYVTANGVVQDAPRGSCVDLALEQEVDAKKKSFTSTPPLTIMEQGLATRGKLLCAGSHWHEDMILSKRYLRDSTLAQSLAFCSVYTASRSSFMEVLYSGNYPHASKAIKMAAVKLAMRRLVRLAASIAVGAKTLHLGTTRVSSSSFKGHQSLSESVELLLQTFEQERARVPDAPEEEAASRDGENHLGVSVFETNAGGSISRALSAGSSASQSIEGRFREMEAQLLEAVRAEGEQQRRLLLEALAGVRADRPPPAPAGPPGSKSKKFLFEADPVACSNMERI